MELDTVIPTSTQIEVLYKQLKNRSLSISHKLLPSYDIHKEFVVNHPYREWFIVKNSQEVLGNVYVQFDNSVGLNCDSSITEHQITEILKTIVSTITPLASKPSVRFGGFFLNVSSENLDLQKKLSRLGLVETQRTYVLIKNNLSCLKE